MTSKKLVSTSVQILKSALPDLLAVYLFGSAQTGKTHGESDVDVAVLLKHRLPAGRKFEIAGTLEAALRRKVDLVDLLQVPTVFRMQIVSRGECVFDSEPSERHRFETYVYSSYARLNEERREILQDVLDRGTVYG